MQRTLEWIFEAEIQVIIDGIIQVIVVKFQKYIGCYAQ